jgi:pantetheine-phosphate adenylyltransferase
MINLEAIYPGTFDPFTLGHFDILRRSAKLFDRVTVVIATQSSKTPMFSAEHRFKIVIMYFNLLSADLRRKVSVITDDGLMVDFVEKNNIGAIIRGIRGYTDIDHEFRLELYNSQLCDAETIYLTPRPIHLYTSSSAVKDFIKTNKFKPLPEYLPVDVIDYIKSIK